MKLVGRLSFLLFTAFFLSSCGSEGNNPLKEERFYLKESNKAWLTPDSIGDVFIMKDMNGISSSFTMTGRSEEMGKSWSTIVGINTLTTYTEECFLNYKSSFGMHLTISMRANSEPHGDNIFLSLDDVGFHYDFDFEQVNRLDTPFGYKSLLTTDKGYEIHGDGEIYSQLEFMDTLSTTSGEYTEVMHFIFNDFRELWNDNTITEIWLVRDLGLVKYKLAGGITAERNSIPR